MVAVAAAIMIVTAAIAVRTLHGMTTAHSTLGPAVPILGPVGGVAVPKISGPLAVAIATIVVVHVAVVVLLATVVIVAAILGEKGHKN